MLNNGVMPHVCENYKRWKNYWARELGKGLPFPEVEAEKHEEKLDLVQRRHDEPKRKPADYRKLFFVLITAAIVAASGIFALIML